MSGQTEEGLPGVFPERRASVVTDRALAWLKKNGGRKFFLWAHYYDPHAPYNPPEPYKRTYAHDLYSGEIANMDEQVGRLLDGISRAGLAGRTLIIVIGDHGESLGEHGEMTHGVFLYDSTLHVPLIVAGPEVHAGKVVENQVRSIDLMRSEEHTSELQSHHDLVCRLLLEKKKHTTPTTIRTRRRREVD